MWQSNRIGLASWLLIASIAVSLASGTSFAQDPVFAADHFQILPRLSTLHRTGGFAGVDERHRLVGSYDLRLSGGWSGEASFENAEIWGSLISDLPHIAIVEDVDEILNLEGLKGEQLPVAAPFDVYRFTGETGDGSAVELFASVLGPWMYVRGGTQPPAGSADFFEYELQMVARSSPFADLNDDGVVDAADYTLLRDTNGGAGSITAGVGIDTWRAQFGERVPDFAALDAAFAGAARGLASAGFSTAAVPEPTAWCVALVGCLAVVNMRRRRARR